MRPKDAALTIARRFGVAASEPVMLSDSNNVVVWLRPSPVVAKVAAGHRRRPSVELAVTQHLVSRGAPVVPPADQLPRTVHRAGGFEVTFWQYQRRGGREPDEHQLAGTLSMLHHALLGYSGALPSYQDELNDGASTDRRSLPPSARTYWQVCDNPPGGVAIAARLLRSGGLPLRRRARGGLALRPCGPVWKQERRLSNHESEYENMTLLSAHTRCRLPGGQVRFPAQMMIAERSQSSVPGARIPVVRAALAAFWEIRPTTQTESSPSGWFSG